MTSIGYATLQIIPSLDGVSGAVQKQLGFLPQMGKTAGKALGDGLASGVDDAAKRVEQATAKIEAANKKVEDSAGKVRVAEAQLQALRDKGITDVGRLAAAEEKLAAAQRNAATATKAQETASTGLERAQEKLAAARTSAANGAKQEAESTSRFGTAIGQMGEKAGGAIGNLKNLAVAAAGIGSAMEIATSAMDFESATAKMNATLGATGGLAEDYGKSAATLYGKGFGDSMGDVTKAVEAVATTMPVIGFEGEVSLDKAAERAMNLAKVFDIDVAEAVQSSEQLITNGLAKDSTQAMDLLTTAMQRVPAAMRGELPEILGEYGKHFQTFGLSGQAAMGLIVDMAPQGKIALDKTGDAIKELSIRATDGSKLTTDAFQAIKVDGDKMAKAIASGGPGAQAAMQDIAKGLLTIQDPAQRAQQAIALFGTPLEDLGVDKIPDFLTALSGAGGSMAGFEGATDELGRTLNDTAQSKLTAFGRGIQTGIVEGLGSAIGFIQENKQLLTDLGIAAGITGGALLVMAGPAVLSSIKTMITSTRLWAVAQGALNLVMSLNPLGAVVLGLTALVAGIVVAYRNSETFRNVVAGAWNWIKDAAAAVVSWFTDTAWPFLQSVWDGIGAGINGLVSVAGTAWDMFTAPARAMAEWFTGTLLPWIDRTWENFKTGLRVIVTVAQEVWDGIKEKFSGIADFVGSLPSKISEKARGMWDGIKEAFKNAINWIIRAWNGIEFKIPGFKVGPVGYDGFTLGVPDIPEFFKGGHTGPGAKYDVAGIVHADEFVLSKRARATLEGTKPGGLDFMNKTGQWPGYAEGGKVGYGLPVGTSISYGQSDKFPEWVRALEQRFGVKASTYAGHQEKDGHNKGIDWSGPVDAMQKFAEFAANAGLEQVIWQNPTTGQKIGVADGKPVGPGTDQPGYYRDDFAGHTDHVHTRQSWSWGEPPAAPAPAPQQPAADAAAQAAADDTKKPADDASKTDSKADDDKKTTPTPAAAASSSSSSSGGSYPTSISGWAGFIGEHFVGGQIKSLLSVFGIPDSPGWMKGATQLLGGIKVSDKDGKSVFDGSNPLGGLNAAIDGKPATPAKDADDKKTPAKTDDKATVMPGGALPIPGQQPAAPAAEPAKPAAVAQALVAPAADYNGGTPEIHNAVYKAFKDAGYADGQWGDMVSLINKESSWNPEARNPSSDAYGLGQFLTQGNIDKYLGGKNRDVPVDVQSKAIMQYVKDRYGDPAGALAFHQKNNWYAEGGRVKPFLYDAGGLLPQGLNLVENRSGGPEPVLTQDYWRTAKTAIDVVSSTVKGQAGGQTKQIPPVVYNIQARDTEDAFIRSQRQERERAAAKLSRF
ncbi:hypothetical protein [Tsukamurella sp. 1534]|uniref:aggregation-promoting factor C-terminal-like domain-containing protein n=1 Tax=Tsukamurella sp. 1534 TaxID=1151061 RepID=UPI00031D0225|nr:hypothetical protein [Tsukamurella sp. 1534]